MLVAIISDIHDNEANLKKILDYCAREKIGTIICCGDLASIETLDFLNDNFRGIVFYTFGNMDNDYLKNYSFLNNHYKRTEIFKIFGEADMEKNKIAFVHFPEKAKKLSETGKYKFVFYGHTHKPWTEKINNCTMLNPGNVTGTHYLPTFAVWNTENDNFKLIRIHDLK
jgi:hypothetical protein